jgi:hypothetical protein
MKVVLKRVHQPTREGNPPFFEKKFTFEESFARWTKFLEYSTPEEYVNGFMTHSAFVHARAANNFKRLGVVDLESITGAMNRAKNISYEITSPSGALIPSKLMTFLQDEQQALRRSVSVASIVKEREDAVNDAEIFKNNPHPIKCGINVDCGSVPQMLTKIADAVAKLKEAEREGGRHKYRQPTSERDRKLATASCQNAYVKANRLSANSSDFSGNRDTLFSECNFGLSRLNY